MAWKFAGDNGEIHGMLEEKYGDDVGLKVEVDCLVPLLQLQLEDCLVLLVSFIDFVCSL